MVDLGKELREAREAKGISVAEAEAATRIKGRYLKALEGNDWAALPTQVQARGFLHNYAVYLGLDEEQVMSWFGQATRSAGVSLPPPAATSSPVPTTNLDGAVFRPRDIDIDRATVLPAWLSSDVLIGIVLALVVAAVGFGLLRIAFGDSNETSTVPTQPAVLTPVMTGSAPQSPTGAEMSAGATPTFDASTGSVQLALEATEHVWVRVTVDGAQVLEGILAPGDPRAWQGAQQITLETANGTGLMAVVNGQPQGPLGERGQVILLTWGPNGLLPVTPAAVP